MKLNVIIITSEASSIAISVPCFHNWSIKMDCRNTSKTSFKKWNMALSNWLWLLLSCFLFLSRQSKWKRKNRSSHLTCSLRKGVLRNFAKFTGKHLCQGLYFVKIVALAQVFFCKFCKISKNTFFTEHVWAFAFQKSNDKI